MSLPNDVTVIISDLRANALASSQGELAVVDRNRVLNAMGEAKFDAAKKPERTQGLLRRLRLAELCLERVYPAWAQHVGTTDPLQMVEGAHAYLDGKINWDQAWEIKNRFSGGLQYVYELPEEGFHATYAGISAVSLMLIPLYDNWHQFSIPDDARDESWDPYFSAGACYAHDLPWGDQFQPERFREFWLWWLDSAVPTAWDTPQRWW